MSPPVSSLLSVCLLCVSVTYCLQSNPVAVSRGVSQPDPVSDEPADLFGEEEASSPPAKPNGVHSDDDSDLFAG